MPAGSAVDLYVMPSITKTTNISIIRHAAGLGETRGSSMNNQIVDRQFLTNTFEAVIRVGLVLILVTWCFQIVRPFISLIVWAIVIAVALNPSYEKLARLMGERRGLAAAIVALITLTVLTIPAIMLSETLVVGGKRFAVDLSTGTLTIPPPPESVGKWPLIGEPLERFWTLANANLKEALFQLQPQLKQLGVWLLGQVASAGLGILHIVLSIIISGVLLATGASGHRTANRIATRLMGDDGKNVVNLSVATIRSVAQGVLGIALLQAILGGLGLLAVDVPAAGIWAAMILLLAIVQLPPLLILGPIIVYVFVTNDNTLVAVLFMIWSLLVSMSDTFLKPLLLGRGVQIPMLVILLGAIGGLIASGFIGLFVGAVILALGYTLLHAWLYREVLDEPHQDEKNANVGYEAGH
jgi:predicted PurR-regulated permease PerM